MSIYCIPPQQMGEVGDCDGKEPGWYLVRAGRERGPYASRSEAESAYLQERAYAQARRG